MADTRNHKTRRREERQQELREYLSQRGKVDYVFDNIEKMENDPPDDAIKLNALKYATDARLKMLNKYLPDMHHSEVVGEGGGELIIKVVKYSE